MKLLAEISDATLGIGNGEHMGKVYELRKSARAILRKEDGTIAVQRLRTHQFHKLPGGGVENEESLEKALKRELKEEVGCDANIQDCIGMVIEYRAQHNLIALSYCFVADVFGTIGETSLDEAERAEGVEHIWVTAEEAVSLLIKDRSDKYQAAFIQMRELAFLREYVGNK